MSEPTLRELQVRIRQSEARIEELFRLFEKSTAVMDKMVRKLEILYGVKP